MKISFLIPHVRIYGGIRRVFELSNELVARGHDVYIFHSNGSLPDWFSVKAEFRSEADFVNFQHEHLIYIFQDQYKIFKEAHAQQKYTYILNLYNKKRLFLPLWLLKIFDLRAYFSKQAILDKNSIKIVNCSDTKYWLKRYLGIDSFIVFGGINPELFHPVLLDKDPKKIKILALGSNKYWKGTDVVIRAVELAKEKDPRIYLETYFEKGIPQSLMANTYSSADLFVDAQYYAGWNNPIAEAMACKVPVICGDIGPNKDIAINRETAIMVPVKKPNEYASAILELVANQDLRDHLVENAYKKASQFTWGKAAEQLIDILRS